MQVRGLDGGEIPHERHDLYLHYGRFLISEHIAAGGKELGDYVLPEPIVDLKDKVHNNLIAEKLSIDIWEGDEELESMVSLNAEQRACYEIIFNSMAQPKAMCSLRGGAERMQSPPHPAPPHPTSYSGALPVNDLLTVVTLFFTIVAEFFTLFVNFRYIISCSGLS